MKPSKENKKTSKKPTGPKGSGKASGPTAPETPKAAPVKPASKTAVGKPTAIPAKPVIAAKPVATKPEIKRAVVEKKEAAKPVAKKKVTKSEPKSIPTPAPAPAKTEMKAPTTPSKPAAVESNPKQLVSIIEVKMDAGFGNAFYVRGEGAGLSWESGVVMKNIDSTTWRWSKETKGMISFKVLLNDRIWALGEDLVVPPGEKVVVKPEFFQ